VSSDGSNGHGNGDLDYSLVWLSAYDKQLSLTATGNTDAVRMFCSRYMQTSFRLDPAAMNEL
jgi:hypothetical protein